MYDMEYMRRWEMGKIKNIFEMKMEREGLEEGTYEGALNIARKALDEMD